MGFFVKNLWLLLSIVSFIILLFYSNNRENTISVGLSGTIVTFLILYIKSVFEDVVYRKDNLSNNIKNREKSLSQLNSTIIIQDFFDNYYPNGSYMF